MRIYKCFFLVFLNSAMAFGGIVGSQIGLAQDDNTVTIESTVTGNQEQPNVLTIVPWKQADDFQVIQDGYDAQMDRIFPHLEPTEFERRRYFAKELETESTP